MSRAPLPTAEAILEAEIEAARAAMAEALAAISEGMREAVDPKAWTRAHPIVSTTLAAATGFAAAKALFLNKQEQMIRSCAEMLRKQGAPQATRREEPRPSAEKSTKQGFMGMILGGLTSAAVESLRTFGKMQAAQAAQAASRAAHNESAAERAPMPAADAASTHTNGHASCGVG